ncbi:hypothetical protein [Lentilactobacillus senioris]|uniref:hypothetical protein n=1 Tax=Lentilactobacillus senioris TaxID=931534 RepID=UPI003D292366
MPAYFNGKKVAGVRFNGGLIYAGAPAPKVPLIKSIKMIISNGNANPSTGTLGTDEVNSDTMLLLSNGTAITYATLKSNIISAFVASNGSIVTPTVLNGLMVSIGIDKLWWGWSGGFMTNSNIDSSGGIKNGVTLSVGRVNLTQAMLNTASKTGAYVGSTNYFNGTNNVAGNAVDLTLIYSVDKSADLMGSPGKTFKDLFG